MNDLIKISEAGEMLGISSRTLRYYEEIGLINSIRPQFEAYRYYDQANIERMKQICILRKMQIPIKDIKRIYDAKDIKVVVETFLKSINDIDMKITSLSELRKITNRFIEAMLHNGISHINALPIIYEKIQETVDKEQEELIAKNEAVSYEKLQKVSEQLEMPCDPDIVSLPAMKVWTSIEKSTKNSNVDGFYEWLDTIGIYKTINQRHMILEYQSSEKESVIIAGKTVEIKDAPFEENIFEGGLYAAASIYVDEDMEGYSRQMIQTIDDNAYYEIDYGEKGTLRNHILAEEIRSMDRQREKIMLYVPVKRRLMDASLFEPFTMVEGMDKILLAKHNQILWTKQVAMDQLTPIMDPYYQVNDKKEAEYIPYIDIRRLSTDVEVSLPFQIDIEFKIEPQQEQFQYGSDEGSIRFYYGNNCFGVNMENCSEETKSQHAIIFQEPIFGDRYQFSDIGQFKLGQFHHLTWIVGKSELAVILDDKIRFCGTKFPYMKMDFHEEPAQTIVVGSNGQSKLTFREISVTQLKLSTKSILKGDYEMNCKRSNNMIPKIHQLITKNNGENYWFNGAARYVMEAKGETQFDYEFWAGLTGDVLTQTYSKLNFLGDGLSEYFLDTDDGKTWIENLFEKAGYSSTFVLFSELSKNKEMYLQTLMAYIDQGVPVIWKKNDYTVWNVIVGYEEYGKTLLVLTDEATEPSRIASDIAMDYCTNLPKNCAGWIFVGGKQKEADVKMLYREAVLNLPALYASETEKYCFGGNAFRAWAETVEGDAFKNMDPKDYDEWAMYKSYVCCAATNSSCCYTFLSRAYEYNPDLACIGAMTEQYNKMKTLWGDLEKLGGGFGVSLETLRDPDKSKLIADKIREFAECADKIKGAVEKQNS